MSKVQFKVSAKAARLIGRENITGADGAIIELVKNSYDADAECVYLKYDIKYPYLLREINCETIDLDLSNAEKELFVQLYKLESGKYIKRGIAEYIDYYKDEEGMDEEKSKIKYQELELIVQKILFKRNTILLIDNGCGMDKNIVENSWMRIGTSYKETKYISDKGRIKTGAKGIGRFALDKLSTESQMFTQSKENNLLRWKINWEQFSNSKLLSDIDAELDELQLNFESKVKELIGDDFERLSKYNWESGTIIILNPLRELWNDRLYNKINITLNNLNPISNEDTFDLYVTNIYAPLYSAVATKYELKKSDYDYRISSYFDGIDDISIRIERNEMITDEISFKQYYKNSNSEVVLNTRDFWNRKAFENVNYSRKNYDTPYEYHFKVFDFLKEYDRENIEKVGPFSFEFYFLKSMKSDFPIIKNVVKKKRKELLDKNAGIKLYRDDFKVRPYGEEGGLFDWLGLSALVQKQPAAVTHLSGQWNVPPYQIIGSVKIGRDANELLYDMANREGLVQNEQYYVFVDILLEIIKKFEFDRQYYYREYSRWIDENEPRGSKEIINTIINEQEEEQHSSSNGNEGASSHDQSHYTEAEYKNAVKQVYSDKKKTEEILQLLMAFSSSGIITNTFAHELSRVSDKVGNRMLHIKSCIDDILGYNEYSGDETFNPYPVMEDAIKNDEVLQSWMDVIMNAINNEAFDDNIIDMAVAINDINKMWKPLMDKKIINISIFEENSYRRFYTSIATIDLFTIINNLNLNSAWFLEKKKVEKRVIEYSINEVDDKLILSMKNNGPRLDEKYRIMPNMIFQPRETSKGEEGTGLGLWIVKQIMDKYKSQINAVDIEDGFLIEMIFDREVPNA